MPDRILGVFVPVFLLCPFACNAVAQCSEKSPWIGVVVCPKKGTQFLVPTEVSHVKGQWLWVETKWVKSSQVVTVDRALGYYDDWVRREPNDPNAYFCRAWIWLQYSNTERALADFSETIRLSPTAGIAYNGRGIAFCETRDFDRAIADFTEAIRLNKNNVDIGTNYSDRGAVWLIQGEFDKAARDFEQATALDPKNPAWHYNLALSLQMCGRPLGAVEQLDDAAKHVGQRPFSEFSTYFGPQEIRGRFKPERYQKIRVYPLDALIHDALAWILATCPDDDLRDGKRAVKEAKIAAERTKYEDSYCLDTLAAAYAESGDFAEAVQWQEKAIEFVRHDREFKNGARARLTLYRDNKPFHEPWK